MRRIKTIFLFILFIHMILIALVQTKAENITEYEMRIRLLQTTDLHANMLGYDYKSNQPTIEYGLSRTAALIKHARKEEPNSLLFDTGDLLVGNALDEYVYKSKLLHLHKIHPVYQAMNVLKYDAATVGNHEFNHGLDFLSESLRGANFPYVNANVYWDDRNQYDGDDLNYFNPYVIVEREFIDTNGKKQKIKIGVIGFITPITAEWDKVYFKNRLVIKNITKTAEHFIPIMKEKGAEIIIALAHVGLEADRGLRMKKGNSVYALSKVKGIDAILYGHSHSLFPMKGGLQYRGIDHKAGTINGVPAVQAGYWGNHLGIIDLYLSKVNGEWIIENSQSLAKPIYRTIKNKKTSILQEDPLIIKAVKKIHYEILKNLQH